MKPTKTDEKIDNLGYRLKILISDYYKLIYTSIEIKTYKIYHVT